MIPKVGDIVRLNPAGSGHEDMGGRWANWGGEDLEVAEIEPSSLEADFIEVAVWVGVEGSRSLIGFGIRLPEGRFHALPPGSPPLFLSTKPDGPEPRNNDGREECFWCCIPTEKRGDDRYDVCPNCGR